MDEIGRLCDFGSYNLSITIAFLLGISSVKHVNVTICY